MNDIIYVGKHAKTFSVSKHLHNNWELIYCTSGSGELIFPNMSMPYETGSLAIIPPKTPHRNQGSEGFTNIHVIIGDSTLNYETPVVLTGFTNGYLKDAFSGAFYYYSTGGAESAALLPIYGQLIVTMIDSLRSKTTKNSYFVTQISDHILRNYPDPNYDLNSYLESFSFSTEYLKRIFKQEFGMTPHQYMTDKRLENAAKNLSVMDDTTNISQIAMQCGFNDPLYFSKLFKRKYGVSPKNYRPMASRPGDADSDSTKIFL